MDLLNLIKSNKIASITGSMTAIGMLIAGIWAVDARFAKAADINQIQRQVQQTTQDVSLELQIQLNDQSIRGWQEKIDDLEDKERLTVDERKKKARWQRNVDDLKQKNQQLRQQQFELRKPR